MCLSSSTWMVILYFCMDLFTFIGSSQNSTNFIQGWFVGFLIKKEQISISLSLILLCLLFFIHVWNVVFFWLKRKLSQLFPHIICMYVCMYACVCRPLWCVFILTDLRKLKDLWSWGMSYQRMLLYLKEIPKLVEICLEYTSFSILAQNI